MGMLQGIFKARDKPKDALGGSRYSFFFGSTSAGKPVNEQTAMQMTAVYSCVRILSETLAGLPLHVKQTINDTLEIKVEIHDDNVFTTCPDCGVEICVDISELLSDGESDLYGTAIFCPDCSKSRLEEL